MDVIVNTMILAQSTPGDQEQVFLNILTKATSELIYYYFILFFGVLL
jgi:hypothetical protein